MESLRTVLNALAKSSLTSACHGVEESKKACAAWTIASHPPDIPSCLGASKGYIRADPQRFVTLDVKRRRVRPTAMGRRPPFFSEQVGSEKDMSDGLRHTPWQHVIYKIDQGWN